WIISQHFGSPLVQVTQTPFLVISHLQMPMVRLQEQTIMPFIMMQQLHIPPASIVHRFCTMLAAIGSSQEQVIFKPSLHCSILNVQRGTINQLGVVVAGVWVLIPGMPIAGELIPGIPIVRSIIMVDILELLSELDYPSPMVTRCA